MTEPILLYVTTEKEYTNWKTSTSLEGSEVSLIHHTLTSIALSFSKVLVISCNTILDDNIKLEFEGSILARSIQFNEKSIEKFDPFASNYIIHCKWINFSCNTFLLSSLQHHNIILDGRTDLINENNIIKVLSQFLQGIWIPTWNWSSIKQDAETRINRIELPVHHPLNPHSKITTKWIFDHVVVDSIEGICVLMTLYFFGQDFHVTRVYGRNFSNFNSTYNFSLVLNMKTSHCIHNILPFLMMCSEDLVIDPELRPIQAEKLLDLNQLYDKIQSLNILFFKRFSYSNAEHQYNNQVNFVQVMGEILCHINKWDHWMRKRYDEAFVLSTTKPSCCDFFLCSILIWLQNYGLNLRRFRSLEKYTSWMKQNSCVLMAIPLAWKQVQQCSSNPKKHHIFHSLHYMWNKWNILKRLPITLECKNILSNYFNYQNYEKIEKRNKHNSNYNSKILLRALPVRQMTHISNIDLTCLSCHLKFQSRNHLFQHIRQLGPHGSREVPQRFSNFLFTPQYYQQHGFNGAHPFHSLGSGDSSLFFNILQEEFSETVFQDVRKEVRWHEMMHKGGKVPRLIAIQGECKQHPMDKPIYRHPVDEEPPLVNFSPTVNRIRDQLEKFLGQSFNHVLVQWYRDGKDYISEHTDKTLDIIQGSSIVNVSLGATRVMVLREKKDKDQIHGSRRFKQKLSLLHNSAFVLGWETNRLFTHQIKQDKRFNDIKRTDELLEFGERISLTFRSIGTFLMYDVHTNGTKLYGQGARIKSRFQIERGICVLPTPTSTLENVCKTKEETVKLVHAFSVENSDKSFNWKHFYGKGFDVLNTKSLQNDYF